MMWFVSILCLLLGWVCLIRARVLGKETKHNIGIAGLTWWEKTMRQVLFFFFCSVLLAAHFYFALLSGMYNSAINHIGIIVSIAFAMLALILHTVCAYGMHKFYPEKKE